jgi:hypothetical protein
MKMALALLDRKDDGGSVTAGLLQEAIDGPLHALNSCAVSTFRGVVFANDGLIRHGPINNPLCSGGRR